MSFVDRVILFFVFLALTASIFYKQSTASKDGEIVLLIFGIIFLIISIAIIVKAFKMRQYFGIQECDSCHNHRPILKQYVLTTGIKLYTSSRQNLDGSITDTTHYDGVKKHFYYSCSFCELKKYFFRLSPLILGIYLLILLFDIDSTSPDMGSETGILFVILLISLITVLYYVRNYCPIKIFEDNSISERNSNDGKYNWEIIT